MKFNKWTLGLAACAVVALSTFTSLAQTISVTNVVTATNVTQYVPLSALAQMEAIAKDPTFDAAFQSWIKAATTSTNLAVAGFYGRKATGQDNVAGGLIAYNLLKNMAVIGGAEHLWGEDVQNTFTLSGGVGLNAKWQYNLFGNTNIVSSFNPFAMSLVGSPLSGQNNGALMNVNRIGADIDVFNLGNGWGISLGGAYGNRVGAGKYDGNWIDVFVAVKHKFKYVNVTAQLGVGQ